MNKKYKNISEIKNMSVSLLSEGKTIRIKAHGYSMYPTIKPGTVILIEPVRKKGHPGVGEIVAIKKEKGIIVHRIVKVIYEEGVRKYIARGDSNSHPDPPVTADVIVGRVTGMEGFSTLPENFKRKPHYFLNRLKVIWLQICNKLRH